MNALQDIKRELQAIPGISVSEKGGHAAFLYAHSARRAVEVYPDGQTDFVVECWDSADKSSDDPPVGEEIVPSVAAAVAKVTAWLVA